MAYEVGEIEEPEPANAGDEGLYVISKARSRDGTILTSRRDWMATKMAKTEN